MTKKKIQEMPHSQESEMMVIGCMLTSVNSLNIAADALDESDFYITEHKIIFQTLKNAHKNNKPADVHLVCEELKRLDQLKAVGGAAYIATLAQYAGTSAFIEEYAEIVKVKSSLRRIIQTAQRIEKMALEDNQEVFCLLEEAQQSFESISRNSYQTKHNIRFLDKIDKNYLFTEPQKKPMLLECKNAAGNLTGFLPKSIVAMLVGAGGVGKTHILAQLAVAIASGTEFLDTYAPTEYCGEGKMGNVFLGMGENQDDDIQRILYKASKKLRKHQPDLTKTDPLYEASQRIAPFSFCGQNAAFIEKGKPTRYFRELKMRLVDIAPKGGWSLIILDPVSRLLGADAETDNAAATQFIALLEELTIDLPGNPTVLFAHHVNKSAITQGNNQNQTASRGSSALTDGVRWQMNSSRSDNQEEKDVLILKMTKSNFTSIFEEIKLQKSEDGFLNRSLETHRVISSKKINNN